MHSSFIGKKRGRKQILKLVQSQNRFIKLISRLFVYAAAAVFYLKRSPQPFDNNKTYFTVHGSTCFLLLKRWKEKATKTCFACTVETCGQCNSLLFTSELHYSREQCNSLALFSVFFFLSVLIVLIFFLKKLV